MRGYLWGKSSVRCGFCSQWGHNITSCPDVDGVAKLAVEKIQQNPDYCLLWIEKKALHELKRREERKAKQKKVKRRKPKCSFCGSREHKRNKCTDLTKFKSRVLRANRKWREAFVSHMNATGFGIGSLVQMPKSLLGHWYDEGTVSGLVVGYNKEKLNIFCLLESSEYQSEPSIEVLCEGQIVNCQLTRLVGTFDESIVGKRYSWNHYQINSISAAQAEVSEDFYEIGKDDALEWFFGKISKQQKIWYHIDKAVRGWLR